jgi:hypothetical protein
MAGGTWLAYICKGELMVGMRLRIEDFVWFAYVEVACKMVGKKDIGVKYPWWTPILSNRYFDIQNINHYHNHSFFYYIGDRFK